MRPMGEVVLVGAGAGRGGEGREGKASEKILDWCDKPLDSSFISETKANLISVLSSRLP
jgi:hypothetical protein